MAYQGGLLLTPIKLNNYESWQYKKDDVTSNSANCKYILEFDQHE